MDLPEHTEKARAALHWLERHAPTGVGSEHARQLRIVLRELIDAVDQQPRGAVSADGIDRAASALMDHHSASDPGEAWAHAGEVTRSSFRQQARAVIEALGRRSP